jgi:hypothetical protein
MSLPSSIKKIGSEKTPNWRTLPGDLLWLLQSAMIGTAGSAVRHGWAVAGALACTALLAFVAIQGMQVNSQTFVSAIITEEAMPPSGGVGAASTPLA